MVSDGYDNSSRYTGKNVREALKETDVQLYLIGNEGDGALDGSGRKLRRTIALTASDEHSSWRISARKIVENLKNQYLIGYKSTNDSQDGKWRNVRVKLDPPENVKLNVRTEPVTTLQ